MMSSLVSSSLGCCSVAAARESWGRRSLVLGLLALLARPEEVSVADAVNEVGWTALMAAATGGHAAAIEALLKGGAEVDRADKDGDTALSLAELKRHTEAAALLRRHGAEAPAKLRDA